MAKSATAKKAGGVVPMAAETLNQVSAELQAVKNHCDGVIRERDTLAITAERLSRELFEARQTARNDLQVVTLERDEAVAKFENERQARDRQQDRLEAALKELADWKAGTHGTVHQLHDVVMSIARSEPVPSKDTRCALALRVLDVVQMLVGRAGGGIKGERVSKGRGGPQKGTVMAMGKNNKAGGAELPRGWAYGRCAESCEVAAMGTLAAGRMDPTGQHDPEWLTVSDIWEVWKREDAALWMDRAERMRAMQKRLQDDAGAYVGVVVNDCGKGEWGEVAVARGIDALGSMEDYDPSDLPGGMYPICSE